MPLIELEVFSDIACPWCFIGKRRLEKALGEMPELSAQVRWRAFELQPGLPPQGVDHETFFLSKFGGRAGMEQAFDRVRRAGASEGVAFDFTRQQRAPNTRLAHRLIRLASDAGHGSAVAEAFFRGYFEQGADVSRLDALLRLIEQAKLDWDLSGVREQLAAGAGLDSVLADEAMAAQLGITGVPLFTAQRRLALQGAQPVEVFQRWLAQALALTPEVA